mmetsp:Transcript_28853/g.61242  ORF Transcript_28853/g.61242 Transcript_28853/m.61242 type:complete len:274 (-) Transcript_28853:310-1131(-)
MASSTATTTYLITGASSGIGLELVNQLVASRNNRVFATVRKRGSSLTGVDEISAVAPADGSSVTVVEGVDVTDDAVGGVLVTQLANLSERATIDVVVHNAGSLSGTRDVGASDLMAEQNLDNVTMDRMRGAFEVNALGPLRIQKALMDANLMTTKESDGKVGKVAIISTGLGSIGDNSSGGNYAYRTSKAAVNMIAKSLSCDLKQKGISVWAIAPGVVATEFGPGKETMKGWGAMPVEDSCRGILSLIESMAMDNTGEFHCVEKDGPPRAMPW